VSALYSLDVLRLAADTGATARLAHPDATVERRSPTCGSRITVDVTLGPDGRISGYGHEVRACALGQAAATLVARNIVGSTCVEVDRARDALTDYLAGRDDTLPDWLGIESLAKARDYPARHPSIRLAIEAVAEAIRIAAKVPTR
jgi:NifU-like protein involved in Fe-S cluster formation